MTSKDPQDFLPLHNNWFHILLSLVGCEQHGYGIMQEVLERTHGTVRLWPATLYGSLNRLDDARRRYYKLTRLGRRVLELECERLEAMVRMARKKRKQEAYG
jgi:DNA-binding PadR family transcriptional regulator